MTNIKIGLFQVIYYKEQKLIMIPFFNIPMGKLTKTAKKVAIIQSNYIPWKGYFDMIAAVDEFILY
ncbi:MAG: WbqC family protein, partial [Candidatus Methylumidiphilus sp.]